MNTWKEEFGAEFTTFMLAVSEMFSELPEWSVQGRIDVQRTGVGWTFKLEVEETTDWENGSFRMSVSGFANSDNRGQSVEAVRRFREQVRAVFVQARNKES